MDDIQTISIDVPGHPPRVVSRPVIALTLFGGEIVPRLIYAGGGGQVITAERLAQRPELVVEDLCKWLEGWRALS